MIRLIGAGPGRDPAGPGGPDHPGVQGCHRPGPGGGVRVVLNTGRPIQEAVWFAGEAGCDALLSCLGGAAVVDGVRGETLRRWDMPESRAAGRWSCAWAGRSS